MHSDLLSVRDQVRERELKQQVGLVLEVASRILPIINPGILMKCQKILSDLKHLTTDLGNASLDELVEREAVFIDSLLLFSSPRKDVYAYYLIIFCYHSVECLVWHSSNCPSMYPEVSFVEELRYANAQGVDETYASLPSTMVDVFFDEVLVHEDVISSEILAREVMAAFTHESNESHESAKNA
jgi:hypothetical protein